MVTDFPVKPETSPPDRLEANPSNVLLDTSISVTEEEPTKREAPPVRVLTAPSVKVICFTPPETILSPSVFYIVTPDIVVWLKSIVVSAFAFANSSTLLPESVLNWEDETEMAAFADEVSNSRVVGAFMPVTAVPEMDRAVARPSGEVNPVINDICALQVIEVKVQPDIVMELAVSGASRMKEYALIVSTVSPEISSVVIEVTATTTKAPAGAVTLLSWQLVNLRELTLVPSRRADVLAS